MALVSPYALSVFGGVQEQVLAMSRVLSSRDIDVLVVVPDASDQSHYDTPATIRREGALLSIPANGSRAPVTVSLAASRRTRDHLTKFEPDVVHLHEPFAPVLCYATLRRHAWPIVGTFHRGGGGPAYTLTRPILRVLSRGLDVSAAVSAKASSTIFYGAGLRTTTLFNGFETERFRRDERESNSVATIFFVGRLEDRKGVAVLIEAARLRASVPCEPWRIVIAGAGPRNESLRTLADGLRNVEFVGAISDSEKHHWLRRSDVLVAPSLRGESFGLIILEAMAAETAVVASDIDGYRDAAGGYAELFAPGDAAGLVSAITRALASTPERIGDARAHAERWSMDVLMDTYLDLYAQAQKRFASSRYA